MNHIAKLIKSKAIPFVEVLVRYYHQLGLDEINAMLIAKIYFSEGQSEGLISVDAIASSMSISKKEVDDRIVGLINAGYIELEFNNNKETIDLDAIFEKLGEIIEGSSKQVASDASRASRVQEIAGYVEETYKRILSSSDFVIINKWVDEDVTFDEVKKAVFESLKANKLNIRYADAILVNSRKHTKKEVEDDIDDDELSAILKSSYVKAR